RTPAIIDPQLHDGRAAEKRWFTVAPEVRERRRRPGTRARSTAREDRGRRGSTAKGNGAFPRARDRDRPAARRPAPDDSAAAEERESGAEHARTRRSPASRVRAAGARQRD